MIQIRSVRSDEFHQAIQLADTIFRSNGGKSMGKTYPAAFSPSYGLSSGTFDGDRLVSFIGVVPSIVRIGSAAVRVYSIGAVCTHPEYRGKGYAASILEAIKENMAKARSPLMLVSGGRSLYTRIGCVEFGAVYRFVLDPYAAAELGTRCADGLRVRKWRSTDWFDLRALAQARVVRYEQGLWDLAALIEAEAPASNMNFSNKVFVAEDKSSGQAAGFLVAAYPNSRSSAKHAVSIEWAGSAKAIGALLAAAVASEQVDELHVEAACHEEELREVLHGVTSTLIRNRGTILITDAELLIQQLRPYLEQKNKSLSDQITFINTTEGVEISLGGQSAQFHGTAFTSLVFDGEVAEGAMAEPPVSGLLHEALHELFPIPFPNTHGINYV